MCAATALSNIHKTCEKIYNESLNSFLLGDDGDFLSPSEEDSADPPVEGEILDVGEVQVSPG